MIPVDTLSEQERAFLLLHSAIAGKADGIPRHWRSRVALSERILELADGLLVLARQISK